MVLKFTHEVASRLSAMGHEVVLVTSRPRDLPLEKTIDGYRIIRCDGKYSVYFKAIKIYYKLKSRGWHPDIVIMRLTRFLSSHPYMLESRLLCLYTSSA